MLQAITRSILSRELSDHHWWIGYICLVEQPDATYCDDLLGRRLHRYQPIW